jgi:hypothetical protein
MLVSEVGSFMFSFFSLGVYRRKVTDLVTQCIPSLFQDGDFTAKPRPVPVDFTHPIHLRAL